MRLSVITVNKQHLRGLASVLWGIIGANVALLSDLLAFYVVLVGKSCCGVKENHKTHGDLFSYAFSP